MANGNGGKRQGFKKGNTTQDPFVTYNKGFVEQMNQPDQMFDAYQISDPQERQKRQAASGVDPTSVSLPKHLFIPEDAQSVDIRNLANVPPGLTVNLLTFTCPPGGFTKFIGYAVFCDALMFSLINFLPTVNGVRVFPFHGNPQFNYKIGLGLGPDLTNNSLIKCQLDLRPNDVVNWAFTNNDTVDVAAGIRMSGYFDQSTITTSGRFGG